MGQHHLPLGHLSDSLLHRAPCHKTVYHHLLVLANAVGSAKSLEKKQETVWEGDMQTDHTVQQLYAGVKCESILECRCEDSSQSRI